MIIQLYWFSVAFCRSWCGETWWWFSVDVVDEIWRIMNRVQKRGHGQIQFSLFFSNQTRLQRVLNFIAIAPISGVSGLMKLWIGYWKPNYSVSKVSSFSSITLPSQSDTFIEFLRRLFCFRIFQTLFSLQHSNNAVIWSVVRQPAVHVK